VDPERILRPEEQHRAGDAADVMVGVGAAGRDFERRAREPSTRRSTQNSWPAASPLGVRGVRSERHNKHPQHPWPLSLQVTGLIRLGHANDQD